MNVDHVSDDMVPEVTFGMDRLALIFARQQYLMEKYHHIERASGLMQIEDVPVPLNDPRGQARLKDFAWRITEEIVEATTSRYDTEPLAAITHFQEELSDALHFLVEMLHLIGFTAESLHAAVNYKGTYKADCRFETHFFAADLKRSRVDKSVGEEAYECIEELGMAMNCLKQKPWKQTHMRTDEDRFKGYIVNCYLRFLTIWMNLGYTADQLYRVYWKKSYVNSFRVRSNY